MVAANLVPASPLVPGATGQPLTPAPAQGGSNGSSCCAVNSALRERLLVRKAQLEGALREHNAQIGELQAAWERAKAEEEGRGGGAADAKVRSLCFGRLVFEYFCLSCLLDAFGAVCRWASLWLLLGRRCYCGAWPCVHARMCVMHHSAATADVLASDCLTCACEVLTHTAPLFALLHDRSGGRASAASLRRASC